MPGVHVMMASLSISTRASAQHSICSTTTKTWLIIHFLLFFKIIGARCSCDDGFIINQHTGQCTIQYLFDDHRNLVDHWFVIIFQNNRCQVFMWWWLHYQSAHGPVHNTIFVRWRPHVLHERRFLFRGGRQLWMSKWLHGNKLWKSWVIFLVCFVLGNVEGYVVICIVLVSPTFILLIVIIITFFLLSILTRNSIMRDCSDIKSLIYKHIKLILIYLFKSIFLISFIYFAWTDIILIVYLIT